MRQVSMIVALAVLCPSAALAQTTGSQVPPAAAAASPAAVAGPSGGLSGELGFGQIDEDFFLTVELKLGFEIPVPMLVCASEDQCATRLRFGIAAPLRLRVIDRDPEQGAVLRQEDWDEVSDYLRIIRFVEYGRPQEPFHARVGELGPTFLGHATIINGYYNVITPDLFQLGVNTHVNTKWGGVGALIDNVASPSILGLRTYVRPFAFIDPQSWWTRLAVGTSFVFDVDAPERLARDPMTDAVAVEPRRVPVVADSTTTGWWGLDVELRLLETEMVQLTPYSDLNLHVGYGTGWHTGMLTGFSPLESLRFFLRLEYRMLGEGYLPDYIGPLYEVERYQYAGWGATLPAPKLRIAASQDEGLRHGAFGQLTGDILGLVNVSMAYADYQGADNGTLWLRLGLTPTKSLSLAAFYIKEAFDGFDEAFELDGALLVGDARYSFWGPLFAHLQYNRLYRLRDDGIYETIDAWNVGVGAGLQF